MSTLGSTRGTHDDAEAALAAGNLHLAEALAKQLLAINPVDTRATVIHAIVQAHLGRPAVAEAYLTNALDREPTYVPAIIAMSNLMLDLGRIEEAREFADRLRELEPDEASTEVHFGHLCAAAGQYEDALKHFEIAIEKAPEDPGLRRIMAMALQHAGRLDEALDQLMREAECAPNAASPWIAMGQVHMLRADWEAAIKAGQTAVQVEPDHDQAHLMLALALSESGRALEAEPHLRKAIELAPNNGLAHASLGFWLQEQGRFDEAFAVLIRSIELNPTHGFSYYNYFRQHKAGAQDEPLIKQLKRLSKSQHIQEHDRGYMHYALGKVFEDQGDFASSMSHYDQGNEIAYRVWIEPRPWDREAYAAEFNQKIACFTPNLFRETADQAEGSELPILIVGMIRSGTSLVEQILSAHPEIAGGGELEFWHKHEREAYSDGHLNRETLGPLAQQYLATLRVIDGSTQHITDKLPHNFAMMGLVHAALPNARFIHVMRDPVDNCLSIYTTAFQKPPIFAHKKENIVFAYQEYERLMSHWRSVIPQDRLLEIKYEDLVTNAEATIRNMIAFVGVEWSDACLRHTANVRSVRTPSLWQVRQPIYQTSLRRSERFGPWLGEFAQLAPSSAG
ncbi:MAG: sulfotransferase [Fimbriimonadaceae bacterium]